MYFCSTAFVQANKSDSVSASILKAFLCNECGAVCTHYTLLIPGLEQIMSHHKNTSIFIKPHKPFMMQPGFSGKDQKMCQLCSFLRGTASPQQ